MFEFPKRKTWFDFPKIELPESNSIAIKSKKREIDNIVASLNELSQSLKTLLDGLSHPVFKESDYAIFSQDFNKVSPSNYFELLNFRGGKIIKEFSGSRLAVDINGEKTHPKYKHLWGLTESQQIEVNSLLKSQEEMLQSLKEKTMNLQTQLVDLDKLKPVYDDKFPTSQKTVSPNTLRLGKHIDLVKAVNTREKYRQLTDEEKLDFSDKIVVDAHNKVLEGAYWVLVLKSVAPAQPILVSVKTLFYQISSGLSSVNQSVDTQNFLILMDSICQDGVKQPLLPVRFKRDGKYYTDTGKSVPEGEVPPTYLLDGHTRQNACLKIIKEYKDQMALHASGEIEKPPTEPNYHCSFDEPIELKNVKEAFDLIVELQAARRNLSGFEMKYQIGRLCPFSPGGRPADKPFARFLEKYELKGTTARDYRSLAKQVDAILQEVAKCQSEVETETLLQHTNKNLVYSASLATQVRWRLLKDMSYSPGASYFKNLSSLIDSGLSPLNVVKFLNYSFSQFEQTATENTRGKFPKPPEIRLGSSVRYGLGKYGKLVDYHINGSILAKIKDAKTEDILRVDCSELTVITKEELQQALAPPTPEENTNSSEVQSTKTSSGSVSSPPKGDLKEEENLATLSPASSTNQSSEAKDEQLPESELSLPISSNSTSPQSQETAPVVTSQEIESAIALLEKAFSQNQLTVEHLGKLKTLTEVPQLSAIA